MYVYILCLVQQRMKYTYMSLPEIKFKLYPWKYLYFYTPTHEVAGCFGGVLCYVIPSGVCSFVRTWFSTNKLNISPRISFRFYICISTGDEWFGIVNKLASFIYDRVMARFSVWKVVFSHLRPYLSTSPRILFNFCVCISTGEKWFGTVNERNSLINDTKLWRYDPFQCLKIGYWSFPPNNFIIS